MRIHNLSNLPTIDYRSVKPLQGNLKDLDKKNHDKLLRVLNKRGFTTPLFTWKNPEDNELYLLDGHQRSRVMTTNDLHDDGNYEVPYVLVPAKDLKEAKEQLLEITSQYGHMTMEGLDEFAFDLELSELDVNFDALDLDKYLDGLTDTDEADDEAPEVDEVNPPVSVLGEVYQLGSHRLMCGDSTDADAVAELMDGAKADMVYTDPPYGMSLDVDYDGMFSGDSSHKQKGDRFTKVIADDSYFDPTQILNLCSDVKEVFLWGADYFYDSLPRGGSLSAWDKRSETLDKVIGNTTEFLWSKQPHRRMTARVLWSGHHGMGQDDDKTRIHPTQKPITLHKWFFDNYGSKHNIVLDLFGGSGSTLIACEQTNRICYMMELDPKYVDVIRKRYAKHIGQENWEEATPSIGVTV